MKRIMNLFIAAIVVIAIAVSIPTAYYFFTQEKQHWAMPAIEGLNQNGIHFDWPEGELDKPITRGEFASLCVNAFNTGADDGSPLPFGDVPDTHPFYAGVAAAYRNGWISGVDGQTAKNAGLPFIWVSWGFRKAEEMPELPENYAKDAAQLEGMLLG